MFTGIIEEIGRVVSAAPGSMVIAARQVLTGASLGSSMAVNGACLTVTGFNSTTFTIDVMPETLKRTNLGRLHPGDPVNLEGPLALGGQVGGHLVQGHVDATGQVVAITPEGEALLVRISAPSEVMRFTVAKGFIAVDGISLTIVDKESSSFRVSVVDYTRRNTTLGSRQAGDIVNLEVDIIAKYVAEFSQVKTAGVTEDFLQEHGFLVR